jgi:Tfp pilus assembly protein FimT
MPGALKLVEILATLYLLAIIGALAYAAARAWRSRRGPAYRFSRHAHHQRP